MPNEELAVTIPIIGMFVWLRICTYFYITLPLAETGMLFGTEASCRNVIQLQISFWPSIVEFIWPGSKIQFAYCPGV